MDAQREIRYLGLRKRFRDLYARELLRIRRLLLCCCILPASFEDEVDSELERMAIPTEKLSHNPGPHNRRRSKVFRNRYIKGLRGAPENSSAISASRNLGQNSCPFP